MTERFRRSTSTRKNTRTINSCWGFSRGASAWRGPSQILTRSKCSQRLSGKRPWQRCANTLWKCSNIRRSMLSQYGRKYLRERLRSTLAGQKTLQSRKQPTLWMICETRMIKWGLRSLKYKSNFRNKASCSMNSMRRLKTSCGKSSWQLITRWNASECGRSVHS